MKTHVIATSCNERYFSLPIPANPELAHRLQTLKMVWHPGQSTLRISLRTVKVRKRRFFMHVCRKKIRFL